MKNIASTYIALGSNVPDKMHFLQLALNQIHLEVGTIVTCSSLYATQAQGFFGDDFLNMVAQVQTRLSPQELLNVLLEIEKKLGRVREGDFFSNRTIDLDILFFEDEVIHSKHLNVPHLQLHKRNFVLYPLNEIAPDFVHPELKKSVKQMCAELEKLPIQKIDTVLDQPQLPANKRNYLAIEGNIGAGKTSLATMIAQDYGAKLIPERFKDNPFLPKFYKDQARYAFPLEMSFLADRYQQLLDDIGQYDLFSDFMVADYDVYKSLIFAKVTLQEEEYALYKKLFNIMYKDLAKPDLYVYLYQNTERLMQNIKKRGRSYEQNIPQDYLEKINQGYLGFIKNQHHLNVKIIDISKYDFVQNRADYLALLEQIASA